MAAQGLELPLLDTTFELLLVSSVWQFHGHILSDLKKRTCPSFLQSLTLLYRISDSKNEKNNYQFIHSQSHNYAVGVTQDFYNFFIFFLK